MTITFQLNPYEFFTKYYYEYEERREKAGQKKPPYQIKMENAYLKKKKGGKK